MVKRKLPKESKFVKEFVEKNQSQNLSKNIRQKTPQKIIKSQGTNAKVINSLDVQGK